MGEKREEEEMGWRIWRERNELTTIGILAIIVTHSWREGLTE